MRTIFAALVLLVSVPASADWTYLGESGAGKIYIDLATVKKTGSVRRFWMLYDFKELTRQGFLSRRSLEEYDCREQRKRILARITYSGNMALGKPVGGANSPGEWQYPTPEDAGAINLKFVCSS